MSHVLAQDLRNAVLQAAFEGKLSARLETDGNVFSLLKEIESEKAELVKLGKAEKPKKLPPINEDDIPFDIPETWTWERWGNLSNSIQYGVNAGAMPNGNAKLVRISDVQDNQVVWQSVPFCVVKEKDIDQYLLNENDILFARTGGTVGKSVIVKNIPQDGNKYIFAGYLIRSNYSSRINYHYLKYFMDSQLYWDQLKAGTIGSAQPNCNGKTLSKMLIPLPPIEEQARIVARVDELMAKIDEYEKIEKELTKLQKAFPGDMKNAILQAAFSGALSKQNENDHSAFNVLKELEIREPDDNPYDLPNNWVWTRFGDVSTYTKSKKKINARDAESVTWMLDMEDIEKGGKLLVKKTVAERKAIGDKTIFTKGNILYAKLRPYLQKIIIAEDDGICTPELVPFDMLGGINSKYALYYLKSPYVDSEVNKASYGVKMPRVGTETMKELRFPVCPAEEQAEIVHRLDTIIPLCDQLLEVA